MQDGILPPAHDDMMRMIDAKVKGKRFLEICCGNGLLSLRIARTVKGSEVLSTDGDTPAFREAANAGMWRHEGMYRTRPLKLTMYTLPALCDQIRHFRAEVIVGFRCFSTLFGGNREFAMRFSHDVWRAGVREMVVEGRRDEAAKRPTVMDDVGPFVMFWEVKGAARGVRYLEQRVKGL